MNRHMSGTNTRKRRTVIGDELLKLLKVELLLRAGNTHFFYSNLSVNVLSDRALM